ncbi:MAG: PHB depolymerase family esterase [Phycisphaerales bacterium]
MHQRHAWISPWTLVWVLAAASVAMATHPAGLFEADGRPAREAVVTAGDDLPADRPTDAPMLDALAGVLAELGPREIASLRKAADFFVGDPEMFTGARRIGVIHLIGRTETNRTELAWLPDGSLVARSLDDAELEPALLNPRRLGELMLAWRVPIPTPLEGDPERWPGRVILTDPVVTQRYLGPGRSRGSVGLPPMERDLRNERFHVRLPEGHDPTRPAGLLVWITPTMEHPWWHGANGAVATFGPIADELGLILIGAERNGNEREILDRLQVALDMVETVRRNHWIDDERVYATGMSGGGRCASILLCSFPDIFAGAVPIVGMNSWHVVELPDGKYIPKQLPMARRDRLALLQSRRMRGITGDEDFNAREMRERTRMFVEDGLQVVLDDYPGMGHAMPTPERFGDAMRWVDEPWRERRAANASLARSLLEAYRAEHGGGPPETPEAREALVVITRTGPWSDAAWQAAEWLGHDRPG